MPRATNHLAAKIDPKTFEALDDLPAELRREVCFAARIWDAVLVADIFGKNKQRMGNAGTITWLIASIQAGDESDLRDFAAKHQRKYGKPLPCYAAEATILRYQPPVNTHHARSRRAIPLGRRDAWRSSERLMPHEGIDEAPAYQEPSLEGVESRFIGLDFSSPTDNAAAA
jgi:hypothetical protein